MKWHFHNVSNYFKILQNTTNDMMPVQLILYSISTKDIQKTLKMKEETWVYNCLLSLGVHVLLLMYNASIIVVSKSFLPWSTIFSLSHEKLSLHLELSCKWSKMAECEFPCSLTSPSNDVLSCQYRLDLYHKDIATYIQHSTAMMRGTAFQWEIEMGYIS